MTSFSVCCLIICGVLFALMFSGDLIFNRKHLRRGVVFCLLAGVFFPIGVFIILSLGLKNQDMGEDKIINLLWLSLPSAAVPFILLKFCWSQKNNLAEFELKKRELDIREKESR